MPGSMKMGPHQVPCRYGRPSFNTGAITPTAGLIRSTERPEIPGALWDGDRRIQSWMRSSEKMDLAKSRRSGSETRFGSAI